MREFILGDSLPAAVLHTIIAAVILTLTGPFGTYVDFGIFVRFQFWLAAMFSAGLFIHTVCYLALMISDQSVRTSVLAVVVGASLGSVPAAAVVITLYSYYSDNLTAPLNFPTIWGNVTVIGIMVALFQFRRRIFKANRPAETASLETSFGNPEGTEDAPFTVPLLERLPKGTTPDQIISFSMQDHYVEVMTNQGPHLVLLRLADAIVLLGDLKGLRIHRSHWIALDHLDSLKRNGRAWQAVTSDGRQLPISATYLEATRTALEAKSAA